MIDDPLVKSLLMNILDDENNLAIVQCLIDGVETDEQIAEKTEIRLNIVRKYLYKLYDFGLASYKRSKDPETQWYTYAWKFEEDEVIKKICKDSEDYLNYLNERLDEEENNMFFVCPEGHLKLDFNNTSEFEFICPECGEEMVYYDNTDLKKSIKEDIETVENNYNAFKKSIKN